MVLKKSLIYRIFLLLFFFVFIGCKEPVAKKFNHSATLFPLSGSHVGVNCRECHKDSSLTSLPTDCQSCHPMGMQHSQNLGDCNLCHTTVTFSAPYYNHNRIGISIQGLHISLVVSSCLNCHKPHSYSGISFTCSNCHKPNFIDPIVHLSLTARCDQCHSQYSWVPGAFAQHNNYATKLTGGHGGLRCASCHSSPFTSWLNINYRDGTAYGSCANCHTRNYRSKSEHTSIAVDANCGRCHGYDRFDD